MFLLIIQVLSILCLPLQHGMMNKYECVKQTKFSFFCKKQKYVSMHDHDMIKAFN